MRKIEKEGKLFAIVHKKEEWKEGLDFLTPDDAFCQVGTWWYQEGKILKSHRHIYNERPNTLTQECTIVMNGSMKVILYDDSNKVFHEEILKTGDFMIMLAGGHGYEILDKDTKIIECKNGPFVSVEKDKQLIQ